VPARQKRRRDVPPTEQAAPLDDVVDRRIMGHEPILLASPTCAASQSGGAGCAGAARLSSGCRSAARFVPLAGMYRPGGTRPRCRLRAARSPYRPLPTPPAAVRAMTFAPGIVDGAQHPARFAQSSTLEAPSWTRPAPEADALSTELQARGGGFRYSVKPRDPRVPTAKRSGWGPFIRARGSEPSAIPQLVRRR
jgi:hypothetical protein